MFVKVAADASKVAPEGIVTVLPDSVKAIDDPVAGSILSIFISAIFNY